VFVVLEFFRPTRAVTRLFHAFYGRMLLPLAGRVVSGDTEAYAYLSRSMLGFLTREELERAMTDAGFSRVRGEDLTLGIASLVWGIK
jgi:ubiquinone/menaquinone biosynthesis C-methylase UbiE